MLFGLINISATCQTLINNILTEYLDIYAVAYLNDILIYSEDLKNYRKHIEDILRRLLFK